MNLIITGSHLPQMLEILKILKDRGYNVTLIAPGNYTARSTNYRSIPQVIFNYEHFDLRHKSQEFDYALFLREPLKDLNAKKASEEYQISNNFYGLEIPSSDSPFHQNIGPVIPDTFLGLTPVLDSFLNAHPRTILLVRTDTSKSLQLANSSNQITSILNNEYPHIHISKFSPQFAILSHVNTKLFLSHGGAGSSHESMYTTTPMLANLQVDNIVSKYRAADLIEIVMSSAKYQGVKDENGEFKVDNENLLRDWNTPDTRMGFIRENI
ncbi:19160_t:CDS:2 [Gigaspora margarita]|uniref:19160_t:CDS:1 n=1 Tax=Gigaspora margarita TaxID=4874 RepID=A0ABM8VY87_GIGMA|nr:19160_t:CDS:2 [Gigaspora margarita]